MANVKPITAEEIHKIEKESGAEQAYNILLLYGADCFDGNYNDYNRILSDLDKKQIAELIKNSDEWNPDDCAELCRLAGLEEEWKNADGETFESVVFKAAGILNVDIV